MDTKVVTDKVAYDENFQSALQRYAHGNGSSHAIAAAAVRAVSAAEGDLLGRCVEAARKAKRELENGNGEVMSIIAAMSHLDAILSQVREVRG